jgi:glycosyltransferase involved in cell wall biosynthesis
MPDSRLSISVAMATYNGGAHLGDQLRSVAVQTRLPDEIVVGDDRSSDDTLRVVDEFACLSGLKFQVHVNAERLGSTQNFVQVFSRCTGDIIVLSDQDDIWRPDRLAKIESAFINNPHASYVFSNGWLIDEADRPLGRSLWEAALFSAKELALFRGGKGTDVLLRHNVVTGAAMAVRRSALAKAIPIGHGWIHDYWLAWILETSGGGVPIDEPLISYRQHAAQQVGLFRLSLPFILRFVSRNDARQCSEEAAAFRALADRLSEVGAASVVIAGVRAKATFYERRARMRERPACAPIEILRSWIAGDYGRFTPRMKYVYPAIVVDCAASLHTLLPHRGRQRAAS